MNSRPQAFLILATCYFIVFCLLYYASFLLQCGNYIKAEWWVKDIYEYKNLLSRITPSPKIIIIGGSNALFGINSNVIEDITGYNVVNLSSHASLDINFHYIKIKENMNDGDIIVMPLEYSSFYNDDKHTEWFTDNTMAWGQEDYLNKIGSFELIQFIFHVPKKRIYEGILKEKKKNPLVNKDIIISSIVNSVYSGWNGYSYKSLNKYGEMNIDTEPDIQLVKMKKRGIQYIKKTRLSDHFLSFFDKISKLAKERHGKVILTWPASIKNKDFDLSKKDHQKLVFELSDNLEKESITITCNPALFNMDIQYFFNTQYHLNKKGAHIRSELLAHCINDVLQ